MRCSGVTPRAMYDDQYDKSLCFHGLHFVAAPMLLYVFFLSFAASRGGRNDKSRGK
jgi:hypothetical protein